MAEMKLNRKLIEKVIRRIETMPETYDQEHFVRRVDVGDNRPRPACGTAACLAGEIVICAAPSIEQGIRTLKRLNGSDSWYSISDAPVSKRARKLAGFTEDQAGRLFAGPNNIEWPAPYRRRFKLATKYTMRAKIAVELLRAILRTDGKILEG